MDLVATLADLKFTKKGEITMNLEINEIIGFSILLSIIGSMYFITKTLESFQKKD